MRDEGSPHIARIAGGVAQDARAGDRRAVVAERDAARIAQEMIRCQFEPGARAGDRPDGIHARARRGLGAAHHVGDDRGRIQGRFGVGHASHGGETAGDRGGRAGGDRFFTRLAGLAQVHVHIDEAGRDERAGRFHDARVRGGEMFADRDHDAVLDEQVAQRVDALRGIDEPAAANERLHAARAPFTSRSSTAMRTKTPLPTCAT